MRYTVSNTINKPLDFVGQKFRDPDGALEWMPGLTKIERVEGEPLAVGSKSRFTSVHKNKEYVIDETVLEQNLPHSVKFGFTSNMGYNEVEMKFEETSPGVTTQTSVNYFGLKGFMKIMGVLFKGMFKKQSMKYLDGFKAYCEK